MNVLQTNPVLQSDISSNGEMLISAGQTQQPSATLTIRVIMQGKEVGSIIGKKGDNIKRFREESGAKITISDGSCPERIVTISGSTDAILRAFTLIARKFEEVNALFQDSISSQQPQQNGTKGTNGTIPTVINGGTANGNSATNGQSNSQVNGVTLKLIIPASQCGSLIGKAGAKIKEIREMTGANIQVASDMLPNSTERAVTLSGTTDSITKSIYQISCVMLESPPKGPTIPYRPKPTMPPVFFAGGQAYTIQGQFAIPHPDPFITGHHPHQQAHNYHLHHNIHQNYQQNFQHNSPQNFQYNSTYSHQNSQHHHQNGNSQHMQQQQQQQQQQQHVQQQQHQHQQQLNAVAAAAAAAAFFESSQSCALQHQAAAAYLNHQLSSAQAANIQQAVAASMTASLIAASTGTSGSASNGIGMSLTGPTSGSSQSSSTSGGTLGGLNDTLIGGGGSPVDDSGFFHHLHHSLHSAPQGNGSLHLAGTNGQIHSPASQSPGLEHLHSISASPNSAALAVAAAAASAAAASVGDFSTHFASNSAFLTKLHRLALQHAPLLPGQTVTSANLASLANSVALAAATANGTATTNLGTNVIGSSCNAAPSSSLSASTGMVGATASITAEMTIPNDIIGCVIGKGGSKINEIRQLSGASIKISSNGDDSKERIVIISGTAEAINLAQYLISTRTAAILQETVPPSMQTMIQMKNLSSQAYQSSGTAVCQHTYSINTNTTIHPQQHHHINNNNNNNNHHHHHYNHHNSHNRSNPQSTNNTLPNSVYYP